MSNDMPLWQKAMEEGLSMILGKPDVEGEAREYTSLDWNQDTVELGRWHIEVLEKLDDLDAEARRGFTKGWLASERASIHLASNEAVREEKDAVEQIELHDPFLSDLRQLDDQLNKPYEKRPDYIEAKDELNRELEERREMVELRFNEVSLALDQRLERSQGAEPLRGLDAFLKSVQEKQGRENDPDHER